MASINTDELGRRPILLSGEELRGIHIKLAVLSEKLDRMLEDRARVTALEDKVTELEKGAAQLKVWGIVGGGLWSLILTLISLKIWA